MYPQELRYSKDHEWVRVEGKNLARVGITSYAQEELGDVVFVDLPQVGDEVDAGQGFATVESVKAVSDIYAPVSGKIVEVNQALADHPELINESPYEKGWIAVIEMSAPQELEDLMDADAYEAHVNQS